jgi:hypothetical protein
MWGWLILGGVLLWVPALVVVWCLLVVAGRADDAMERMGAELNKPGAGHE